MTDSEIKNYIAKFLGWGGYFVILLNFAYNNKYLENAVTVFEVSYWIISIILLLAVVVLFIPSPDLKVQKMAEDVTEKIREKPLYARISNWTGWIMVFIVGVMGDFSLFTVLLIMNCLGALLQQQALNIVSNAISGEYDEKAKV